MERPAGDWTSSDTALARLSESYWYPIYAYLRRRGYHPDLSRELTSGFFASVLADTASRRSKPALRRFRPFMLRSLKRYVVNYFERKSTGNPGGAVAFASLDFASAEDRFQREAIGDGNSEVAFNRAWAIVVIDRARQRLRSELIDSGKNVEKVDRLLRYLSVGEPLSSYAETARALGTAGATVKVAVDRLFRRLAVLLVEEVRETVSSSREVADEIRDLVEALDGLLEPAGFPLAGFKRSKPRWKFW